MIETGLGGRLDATNVLKPLLTVTTGIDQDHTEILGSTIAEIAYEKAGIIKPCTPHLIGKMKREAVSVMRRRCKEVGTTLIQTGAGSNTISNSKTSLDYCSKSIRLRHVKPSLSGKHQTVNATLALNAIDILIESGLRISSKAAKAGLETTEWPGRFQLLNHDNKSRVILDVCHNPAGAKAFADTFLANFPGQKTEIILGLVRQKDHQTIIDELARVAKGFTLVPLRSRRTSDLTDIESSINRTGIRVRRKGRLESALRNLLANLQTDDIISIVGSHYLVGEYFQKMR